MDTVLNNLDFLCVCVRLVLTFLFCSPVLIMHVWICFLRTAVTSSMTASPHKIGKLGFLTLFFTHRTQLRLTFCSCVGLDSKTRLFCLSLFLCHLHVLPALCLQTVKNIFFLMYSLCCTFAYYCMMMIIPQKVIIFKSFWVEFDGQVFKKLSKHKV